jgi:hypothetical protein
MGYLYKTECLVTPDAAAVAMCAAESPRLVPDGSGSVNTITCAVVDGSHVALTTTGAAGTSTATVAVSFVPCDPGEVYTDMSAVWLLGLGGLVVVWCLKQFVYRQIANQ